MNFNASCRTLSILSLKRELLYFVCSILLYRNVIAAPFLIWNLEILAYIGLLFTTMINLSRANYCVMPIEFTACIARNLLKFVLTHSFLLPVKMFRIRLNGRRKRRSVGLSCSARRGVTSEDINLSVMKEGTTTGCYLRTYALKNIRWLRLIR